MSSMMSPDVNCQYEVGSIEPTVSILSDYFCQYTKYGSLVEIDGSFIINRSFSAWESFTFAKSPYKPCGNPRARMGLGDRPGVEAAVHVKKDGTLEIESLQSTSGSLYSVYFTIVYVCEE